MIGWSRPMRAVDRRRRNRRWCSSRTERTLPWLRGTTTFVTVRSCRGGVAVMLVSIVSAANNVLLAAVGPEPADASAELPPDRSWRVIAGRSAISALGSAIPGAVKSD